MPYFFSIEDSYPRQVAPLFEAHFFQQADTCFIAFEDNRKQMPDLQRRTGFHRMLD